MLNIVELIFDFLKILLRGIFEFLLFLLLGFGTFRKSKYNAKFLSFSKRFLKLGNRFRNGTCINGYQYLSLEDSLTHTLVVAESGGGKSTCITIPTLINIDCSSITIDPDGGVFEKVSGYIYHEKNIKPLALNFLNIKQSIFYNPLEHCRSITELKELAQLFVRTTYPNPTSESTFWSSGAESIIFICLAALRSQEVIYNNPANLLFLVQRFATLNNWLSENIDDQVFNEYMLIKSAESKVFSSWQSTAATCLKAYSDPGIAFVTSKNTLNFDDFSVNKIALFLIIPESKEQYYSQLYTILIEQFTYWAQKNRPKNPTFLLADEGGSYPIFELPKKAVLFRRANIALVLMVQSLAMLEKLYGKTGLDTIWDGSCSLKIIYPNMNWDLAKKISQSMGRHSISLPKGDKGNQTYTTERELLTVDELVQSKKAIVLFKNFRPHLTTLKPYFRSWSKRRKTKYKPVQYEDNVIIRPEILPIQFTNLFS